MVTRRSWCEQIAIQAKEIKDARGKERFHDASTRRYKTHDFWVGDRAFQT